MKQQRTKQWSLGNSPCMYTFVGLYQPMLRNAEVVGLKNPFAVFLVLHTEVRRGLEQQIYYSLKRQARSTSKHSCKRQWPAETQGANTDTWAEPRRYRTRLALYHRIIKVMESKFWLHWILLMGLFKTTLWKWLTLRYYEKILCDKRPWRATLTKTNMRGKCCCDAIRMCCEIKIKRGPWLCLISCGKPGRLFFFLIQIFPLWVSCLGSDKVYRYV